MTAAQTTLEQKRLAALDRAIAQFGTQEAFAKALDIKSPSVSEWRKNGVPPRRCGAVERLTGVKIAELRPDLFGGAA